MKLLSIVSASGRVAVGSLAPFVILAALSEPAVAALPGTGLDARPDTVVFLLEPRTEEQIQADMEAAQQMVVDAARDRALGELRRAEARARVEAMETAIDLTKDEIDSVDDLRKAATDDAVKRTYEVQKDDLEYTKDSQERRKRLFEADEEYGEAARDLAEAQERFAQASMDLHRRELELALASDAARPEIERQVLDAWKRVAERAEAMASREKRVVERQIRVLERAREIREKG